MGPLPSPPQASKPELIDRPGQDEADLAGNLRDLRRVNGWPGGNSLTIRAIDKLIEGLAPGSPVSILETACGEGALERSLAVWSKRRGLSLEFLATDISLEILRQAPRGGTARFALADARRLPFPDEVFDISTCALALHHMSPEDGEQMLREMLRVSRHGAVVNDLVRSWPGYAAARLFSRFLTHNRLTRHDAPLSVLRAYSRNEMAALARRAGALHVAFRGIPGYRTVMVLKAGM